MFFALKLGFTAVTAGLTWYAGREIQTKTNEWEARIEFYDHIAGEGDDIKNILKLNNGHIVDMHIWYKGASSSVNWSLVDLLPIDHLAVVIETDLDEFWCIEKNSKMIHVQKSHKNANITQKLSGSFRNSSLEMNIDKEREFLRLMALESSWIKCEDHVKVNDLLRFIVDNEVSRKFALNDNCKSFVGRLFRFVNTKVTEALCYYDYPRLKYLYTDVYDRVSPEYVIREIKFLYEMNKSHKVTSITGLLMTTSKSYWTIEYNLGELYIQHSYNSRDVMSMVFGRNRKLALHTFNKGPTTSSDDTGHNGTKELQLSDVFKFIISEKYLMKSPHEKLKNLLNFVHQFSDRYLQALQIYDHSKQNFWNCIDLVLNMPINVEISGISLFKKVVIGPVESASISNSLVLILAMNNGQFWSLERVKNSTIIQLSLNKDVLETKLFSNIRKRRLDSIEVKVDKFKPLIAKVLLEFMLELHRRSDEKQCNDDIEILLEYLMNDK